MTKTATPPKPTYVEIDGEEFETTTVVDRDKTYVVREISVGENHEIELASTDKDGKYDMHLSMVLSLAKAIVDPPTSPDAIEKWPGRRYVHVSRAFNRMNLAGAESVPNAQGQNGSNSSTSPTSGESSPAT
jgi:hypothetical protein